MTKLRNLMPRMLLVVLIGIVSTSVKATKPSLVSDTLLLKTEKHKGFGLFERQSLKLITEEISENDKLLNIIPSNISNPKLARELIDYKVFTYHRIKKSKPENLDKFLKNNYPEIIDTVNIPSELDNSFRIIVGMQGLDSIYIIDENNNYDFRDDSVRILKKMDFNAPIPEPIKCHYWIHNGKKSVKDSTWVLVEKDSENNLRISVAHHLKVKLSLNKQEYEIQCINGLPMLRFCFDSPKISITAQNGVKKDSLLLRERLEVGDYLKFGEFYYKFESLTNNGSEITLIKEEDVSGKTGNQVGFMAPNFHCVTTDGDSISLTDYSKDYLLLVNISACWSEPMSYEIYKELSEKYQNKLAILAIDESPEVLKVNIDQLGLVGKFVISKNNYSIKKNFREDFCSRDCYLIDPKGSIIDFFEIFDWEEALAKHFE